MNKEEFLSLLTEKFSGMDAAHLESLAASLAAQQPDAHQGQALVNKLTAEQVADYLAATTPTPTGTTPSVAGDTPSAADSLDKRIEESVRKAVLAFEQRLSLFETQQKQQLQHNRLQEVLAQCQDSNFRMQSLRDYRTLLPLPISNYIYNKRKMTYNRQIKPSPTEAWHYNTRLFTPRRHRARMSLLRWSLLSNSKPTRSNNSKENKYNSFTNNDL